MEDGALAGDKTFFRINFKKDSKVAEAANKFKPSDTPLTLEDLKKQYV